MLSRPQFQQACKAFIAKYSNNQLLSPDIQACRGWSWNEHPSHGTGFMSRQVLYPSIFRGSLGPGYEVDTEAGEDDEATATEIPQVERLLSHQYVVFSATFRVPTLYFTLHKSNGTPLTLDEIVRSPFLKVALTEGSEATTFALSHPAAPLPVLSQGEHPTLGTPCWYLHPCETAAAVNEVMAAVGTDDWSESERNVRWMEAWFMIVDTAVNWN